MPLSLLIVIFIFISLEGMDATPAFVVSVNVTNNIEYRQFRLYVMVTVLSFLINCILR